MPVHVFVTSRQNFEICVRHGLAAVPGGKKPDTTDQLISRMVMIRPNDRLLFYLIGEKTIHGVYRAIDRGFFDDSQVWPIPDTGETYPLRVRFANSDNVFRVPIGLSDIYDLRDQGKIWSFGLTRPAGGSNAMFSISDREFEEVFRLFLQANRIASTPDPTKQPYRHVDPNLPTRVTLDGPGPKYESGLASLFIDALAHSDYRKLFGDYSDYLSYVPTTFQKEIDIILFHSVPGNWKDVVAHSLVELKRDAFGEDALSQLLRYEDWFLKKRAAGDSRAVRSFGVARTFSQAVVTYASNRCRIEGKPLILLEYSMKDGRLLLKEVKQDSGS